MRRPVLHVVFGLLGVCVGVSCGAGDAQAPYPREAQKTATGRPSPEACGSFETLMPRFDQALSSGATQGLRGVMREYLVAPEPGGGTPPMNGVLRAIFGTLTRFASEAPEPGAPMGDICVDPPPPPANAHPLCEMRRAMRTLVHEGEGLALLTRVDPLVSGFLNYVVGKPPASAQPNYEVAGVVAGMCSQSAVCQMQDTLDLVIALTQVAQTSRGRSLLEKLDALVNHPELQPFIVDEGQAYGGEKGMVALAKLFTSIVQGMDGPSDLDSFPVSSLPEGLRTPLQSFLDELKPLLHPDAHPNVLAPLKRFLNCHQNQDPDDLMVRLFYRLGFDADIPEYGLKELVRTVKDLATRDDRSTLANLVNVLARAIRDDEEAVDAYARLCSRLFSTTVRPGEKASNAQRALPVIADLFEQGIATEMMCAADTLVYGCTGGPGLACAAEP